MSGFTLFSKQDITTTVTSSNLLSQIKDEVKEKKEIAELAKQNCISSELRVIELESSLNNTSGSEKANIRIALEVAKWDRLQNHHLFIQALQTLDASEQHLKRIQRLRPKE